MGAVQTIAAHISVVARSDLQSLTVKRYGPCVAALLMVSVVVFNVVTIAADIQAGAAGIGLLADVGPHWVMLPLELLNLALLEQVPSTTALLRENLALETG